MKTIYLFFACLALFSCDKKDANKEENTPAPICWSCIQREIVRDNRGTLVSNNVLVTIETCDEKTKNGWESRDYSVEWGCEVWGDQRRHCGSKMYIYSCYKK